MATANYVLLERIELAADTASVTFNNIPQTGYTDLKIVMSLRSNGAYTGVDNLLYQFNSSTSGYSSRVLYSYSSGSPASRSVTTLTKGSTVWGRMGDAEIPFATATANTFSNIEMYIPNYLSSNYKSFSVDSVAENNSSSYSELELDAGLWSNTSAISSISFTPYNADFAAYSTFSLYGLAAVGTTPTIAPKASGGNITTDGTYWYHTFLSTGAFVPQVGLSCDYLVVGAGGSGGPNARGGGAGGEVRAVAGGNFTASSYTVTIGAGGTWASNLGRTGTSSVITGTNISTTSLAGQDGGDPDGGTGQNGGGSGGATVISSSPPVAGSAGTSNSYSGTATYYGGGGGGGGLNSGSSSLRTGAAGGNGGGGAGGTYPSPNAGTPGTVNSGGGGGGQAEGGSGGCTGGSGIVIIRYSVA